MLKEIYMFFCETYAKKRNKYLRRLDIKISEKIEEYMKSGKLPYPTFHKVNIEMGIIQLFKNKDKKNENVIIIPQDVDFSEIICPFEITTIQKINKIISVCSEYDEYYYEFLPDENLYDRFYGLVEKEFEDFHLMIYCLSFLDTKYI